MSQPGDSQAAQLELLHDIDVLLRLAPAEEIKAAQSELEKQLMAALLQGPAAPIRHLISSSFCTAFSRGARQGMYTTVGQLNSWMSNKSSPASTVAAKVAIVALLGDLCQAQGAAMVSQCHETIALLIKTIRAPEVGVAVDIASLHASAFARAPRSSTKRAPRMAPTRPGARA